LVLPRVGLKDPKMEVTLDSRKVDAVLSTENGSTILDLGSTAIDQGQTLRILIASP